MSWEQLAEIDAFGTSRFQNMCCREVGKFLPLALFEEMGDREKYFVADILVNDIWVYVYRDSAEIVSPNLNIHLQRSDTVTPEALAMELIKALSNAF